MRQIILDTETTGLNARSGDRVLEVGCVEMINRQLTGRNLHYYINPERDSEEGALAVHGLTTEFLRDKPKFAEIANELREFVAGAEIIIHNAPFDVGFLNAEFSRLGMPPFTELVDSVIDSLAQAKGLHPGKRNSLDALCDRYGISNSHRTLHGALLDSELLAEVYLAMTRGQNSLTMEHEAEASVHEGAELDVISFDSIIVIAASEEELTEHEVVVKSLDKEVRGTSLWRALEASPAEAASV